MKNLITITNLNKPFKSYCISKQKQIANQISDAIQLIANDDLNFFIDFFKENTTIGKDYFLSGDLSLKLENIIKNIGILYTKSNNNKADILSLVANDISFPYLNNNGFENLNKRKYIYAQKTKNQENINITNYTRTLPKSKTATSDNKKQKIVESYLDNSNITSETRALLDSNNFNLPNYNTNFVY